MLGVVPEQQSGEGRVVGDGVGHVLEGAGTQGRASYSVVRTPAFTLSKLENHLEEFEETDDMIGLLSEKDHLSFCVEFIL